MEHVPNYISLVFALSTLLTLALLYKAAHYSKILLIVVMPWLVLQAFAGLAGFYQVTNVMPPRFALLVFPPIIFIVILFFNSRGKRFIEMLDAKALTLLHIVRIPVELTLYGLYLHKTVPGIMTFEGRNFDVLSGLTAPLVYYLGYVKKVMGRKMMIAWNILCLVLLANVVVTAILSAPFSIQRFAFDQPNIALLYFPYIWLPCFVVPAVLFAHLVCLRKLVKQSL